MTDYYSKYETLHEETKLACSLIESLPCSNLSDKMQDVKNEVGKVNLTLNENWIGNLSDSYANVVASITNAIDDISGNVSSEWSNAQNTYNLLYQDLNNLQSTNISYQEKVKEEPNREDSKYKSYVFQKVDGELQKVLQFNSEKFTNDYNLWQGEVDSLIAECEDLSLAIEYKKRQLEGLSFDVGGFASGFNLGNGSFNTSYNALIDDILENDPNLQYSEIFKTDGTMKGNVGAMWRGLKYYGLKYGEKSGIPNGLSDAAIAGILGNVYAECSFNPKLEEEKNVSQKGYGIIQWTDSRRDQLERAASQAGESAGSLKFQMDFLWDEVFTPREDSKYSHNGADFYFDELKKNGFFEPDITPTEAARIFNSLVERSAAQGSGIQKRCKAAEEIYAEFAK